MKYTCVILCALVAVMAVDGQGVPTKQCPPGEHSVLYCPRKAEPNCDNPTVHDRDTPGACGTPDCFCNTPTIRNLRTGECMLPEKCPRICET